MMGKLSVKGTGKIKSMFMPLGVVVGYLSRRPSRMKQLLLFSILSTSKEGGQKRMGLGYPNYIFRAGHGHLRDFRAGNQADDLGRWHEFICCPELKISPPVLLFCDVMVCSN